MTYATYKRVPGRLYTWRCDCGCTVIFYLGPKASGLKVCINCKREVKL